MGVLKIWLTQWRRDLASHRLRAALTLFGLVWGTAAVTLLLAFGDALHRQMVVNMKGLGENIVIAFPAKTSKAWQGLAPGRPIRVTPEELEQVAREVPSLEAVSGEFSRSGALIKAGSQSLAPQVAASDPAFGVMRNLIPATGGRFIDPLDMQHRRRVVFLGDELAVDLFGDAGKAVGRMVQLAGAPFLVIGTLQPKTQDSNYSGRDEDKAVIPLTTYRSVFGERYVDNFIFRVREGADLEVGKAGLIAALARIHRFDPADQEAIMMWDTTEQMRFFDNFFLAFKSFLAVLGVLTLVVGGIGVSNVMHVIVEERTREIGIKMALGAKSRFILGQLLFETLGLTVLGGAGGLAIAWVICAGTRAAAGNNQILGSPEISLGLGLGTAALLGVVGFLAGWSPARTASRLEPVEALRS